MWCYVGLAQLEDVLTLWFSRLSLLLIYVWYLLITFCNYIGSQLVLMYHVYYCMRARILSIYLLYMFVVFACCYESLLECDLSFSFHKQRLCVCFCYILIRILYH